MIDDRTAAAKAFMRLVRDFSIRTKTWEPAIFYNSLPDERWDLSLVSARCYGNRDEFLAVLAASGISRFDEPLTERRLVLPTASQLADFKRQAGFESRPDYRLNFAPTWAD
ncbi:MAG: hypothetical protein ACR2HF_13880 [Methylococcaceae bacterium]